uniref:hypothetical protein n=1 Tax=Pseudomonas viridiflava TaxID=33069 RepID=UPI0019D0CA8E
GELSEGPRARQEPQLEIAAHSVEHRAGGTPDMDDAILKWSDVATFQIVYLTRNTLAETCEFL